MRFSHKPVYQAASDELDGSTPKNTGGDDYSNIHLFGYV
jgi:hypothetical protein